MEENCQNDAAHQRVRRIIDSMQGSYFFYSLSPEGVFTYVSPSVTNILGYSPEEFLTRNSKYVADPHGRSNEEYSDKSDSPVTMPKPYEIELRHSDGSIRLLELTESASVNDDGNIYAFEGIAYDMTERAAHERSVIETVKMDTFTQLAGGITHDFNNLLSAIIGYAHLLKLKTKEGDPARKLVEQILNTTTRATNLTRSLQLVSRKPALSPTKANINEIVSRIEQLQQKSIPGNIILRIILNPRFAKQEVNVNVDTGQIEQALINISRNAIDAMPGGGTLTIETGETVINPLSCETHVPGLEGKYTTITISDTGIGMDAQTKEHIFNSFFTMKGKTKHSGIGLTIAAGIINEHNGHITVNSKIPGGTTFIIYLPFKSALPADTPVTVNQKGSVTERGPKTILVVEDDKDLRYLVTTILCKQGHSVIEASDGNEALEIFNRDRALIHLLVSDLIMPGKSGSAVFNEMKITRPDLKAIIISGIDDSELRAKKILHKDATFIQKPVLPDILVAKVREVLGQMPD